MDGDTTFFTWWSKAVDESSGCLRKGLNSIMALSAWSIWKHRNAVIFENRCPSTEDLIRSIKDDARLWAKAGARGLAAIIPVT